MFDKIDKIPNWVWLSVVGYFGYRLYLKNSTTENITFPDTPTPPGPVNAAFVNSMVSKLYEVTSTYLIIDGSDRCKAYKDYYEMQNDSEFVTVANIFKKTYKKTLRQAIYSTYYSGCSYFSIQFDDEVIKRLDKLNVP